MLRKITWIIACIIAISTIPALAAQKVPDVVATVNGDKISKQELINNLVDWQANKVLEEMINYRIVAQEAKKAGVVVTDADIRAKIEEFKSGMPEGQDFEDTLKKGGLTMGHLYSIVKNRLLTEGILKKRIKITSKELAEYRRASHILISPENITGTEDAAAKDAQAKAKIEEVAQKLKDGMKFEDAVSQYSEDPGSKVTGGDLDWFVKERMVPEFSEKTFAMKKVGDVSEPIKSQFGYHIIKLTGIGDKASPAEKKKLSDMLYEQKMAAEYPVWNLEVQNKAKTVNFLEPKKPEPKATPKPGITTNQREITVPAPSEEEGTPPPPPSSEEAMPPAPPAPPAP